METKPSQKMTREDKRWRGGPIHAASQTGSDRVKRLPGTEGWTSDIRPGRGGGGREGGGISRDGIKRVKTFRFEAWKAPKNTSSKPSQITSKQVSPQTGTGPRIHTGITKRCTNLAGMTDCWLAIKWNLFYLPSLINELNPLLNEVFPYCEMCVDLA